MNRPIFCAAIFATAMSIFSSGCATTSKTSTDTRCYEMRTYYAPPGKLDDLHARFRDHTMKLFKKHGIENVGYWVPVDNSENKLIFLLAYPSRNAREAILPRVFRNRVLVVGITPFV